MDQEIVKMLVKTLQDADYDVRPAYSGRGMYGEKCIGVVVATAGEIFRLGQLLADYGDGISIPRTDNMGLQMIAYWPDISLQSEDPPED
jgi:hypothetical protein